MLGFFRKHANSVIVKAFMLFLLLVFALWGVGDLFRSNPFGHRYAFKVGNVEVSEEQWRNVARMQIQQIQAMTGQEVDPAELEKHGFFQNLLDRMVNRALLLAEAKDIGLIVSDEMAKLYLTTQPPFLDEQGKFSKEKLDAALKQNGMSEEQLLSMIKDEMMHDNLVESFVVNPFLPPQMVEVLFRAVNMGKKVTVYELNVEQTKLNEQPTEEVLQSMFEEKRDQFYIPEKRDIRFATIRLSDIEQQNVTDEELQSFYEQRKEMMNIPERRKVQHIVLASADQAQKAKNDMESGKSWQDVAKQYAPQQKLESQLVVQQGANKEIGEAIFATEKGKVSAPTKLGDKFVLFYVTDILPPTTLTLEHVKPELKKQYAKEKQYEKFSTRAQEIEADINANIAFDAILEKYKLSAQNASVTEDQSSTGKDLLTSESLLKQAFATEVQKVSGLTPYGEEQFFFVVVEANKPRQQKPFEDVRTKLVQEWIDNTKLQEASKAMEKLTEALHSKQDWTQIADLAPFKISQRSIKITRGSTEGFPQNWVSALMLLKTGEVSAPVQLPNKLVIAKVEETISVTAEALKKLNNTPKMDRMQGELVLQEYLATLRNKYKITVNQDIIRGNETTTP